MEVKVTLNLDSKEEELLKKVVEINKNLGSESTSAEALTDAIAVGSKWDTFLYEKMCDYLMLMGACTYEKSKNMLAEYKRGLDVEYEKQKKIDEIFKELPITKSDFVLTTGKYIDFDIDIDYIIHTWNECNNDEGKYLINTKDFGIEFGLKEHSLLEEGTVTYETLKSDMERVVNSEQHDTRQTKNAEKFTDMMRNGSMYNSSIELDEDLEPEL